MIPRISWNGWSSSDGLGDDIEGGCLSLEWLGCVIELCFGRRRSNAWLRKHYSLDREEETEA